ncbi:MAG: hypothetical protein JSS62_06485 [Verrucomicrobia bacterium]|nr:hypothetical protein [Verrucomicrobiota bacterium]MBS0646428.1 hypothetical protein [Verrucomicrobiota bacterium]
MDNKHQQLQVELGLLLVHLKLPVEEDKKKVIASQLKGFTELQHNLSTLAPDLASLQFNGLLKKAAYPHQFKFLTDDQARDYIMNHPAVTYLFSVCVFFLAMPIRGDLDTSRITQNKDKTLKLIHGKKLGVKEALQIMECCLDSMHNIVHILDACHQESEKLKVRRT